MFLEMMTNMRRNVIYSMFVQPSRPAFEPEPSASAGLLAQKLQDLPVFEVLGLAAAHLRSARPSATSFNSAANSPRCFKFIDPFHQVADHVASASGKAEWARD